MLDNIFVGLREVFSGLREVFAPPEDVFAGLREIFTPPEDVFLGLREVFAGLREVFAPPEDVFLGLREIFAPREDIFTRRENLSRRGSFPFPRLRLRSLPRPSPPRGARVWLRGARQAARLSPHHPRARLLAGRAALPCPHPDRGRRLLGFRPRFRPPRRRLRRRPRPARRPARGDARQRLRSAARRLRGARRHHDVRHGGRRLQAIDHDAAIRAHDPADDVALEKPGAWLSRRCPITGAPLTDGLAALPFVADRADITSGNVASGGQNVDRLPVERDAMLSLKAVRALMWGPGGQMASPFCTSRGVYNAAIPVLLGPATPAALRDLQKAIGWLCTGTSAFEPAMAEAIPAALGSVLGRLEADDALDAPERGPAATADEQAHALLRTSALLQHVRSYPYVSGTAVLDESAPRQPLPDVWALCLMDGGDAACLQTAGCISSVLARVVAASTFEIAPVARGMFSWACRNIARSVLGTASSDGRGGVEGIRRLAALLCHDVELLGYAPSAPATAAFGAASAGAPAGGEGRLDRRTLAAVLGPELAPLWSASAEPGPHDFVEALNGWISSLHPDEVMYALDRLGGVLERFDEMTARAPAALSGTSAGSSVAPQAVRVENERHAHFNLLALESLSPVRGSTPVPGLADESLEMRRILKFGETTWIPPRDARLPAGATNPSARRFLNEHTAMIPVRALLRLHAADCLGLARLQALRAGDGAPPFPRVDDVLAGLAALLGGMDEVMLLAFRAFAFVVVEANGYADKHWAETPLRAESLAEVSRILGLSPEGAGAEPPVHYGPRSLVISPATGPTWPQMVGKGYLPKSRRVGPDGEPVGAPVRLNREEVPLSDQEICQKGTAAIIAGIESEGRVLVAALHREARAVLGAHPRDLRGLPEVELRRILKEELVPALAGKVKGSPEHPAFFPKCAITLKAMIALGEDTRTFRAEEPDGFLHLEARTLRANAR